MTSLNVKIKADGQRVAHAHINGTEADMQALIDLLEEIMPNPQLALAIFRSERKAEAGWQNMRVIAAGMRRLAGYALDQWEGEERELSEEEQAEVKKLLFEIHSTDWPIPGVTPEQPAALTYPQELSPELDEVLGWPNFICGGYARTFRAAGHTIPEKAEREQAFIHHWLVKLVLRHGAGWREVAQAELQALLKLAGQEGGKAK